MPTSGPAATVEQDIDRRIAQRLAQLRADRGWSLDDLADRQQRVFKATGDLSTAIKNSRKGGE